VPQAKRLFDFIGISKPTDALEKIVREHDFTQQAEQAWPIPVVHGNAVEPPGFFRKGKIDSWREELSLGQKLTVWRFTWRLMHELGYSWSGRNDWQR
jgi:hypothetical protein